MTELLTAKQMRAVEQAAIDSGVVTGLELMERAGRGVVEAILDQWPALRTTSHRAVVLCGPGNNGGDGFVVARLLKDRGWEVKVFLYGAPDRMPPDARVNYRRWLEMAEVKDLQTLGDPPPSLGFDLIVDALFGIGLSRPIEQWLDPMFPKGDLRGLPSIAKVVSIDVPSGLCADSGRALAGRAVLADLTVTFHRAKIGHMIGDGPGKSGRLSVKDIGLDPRCKSSTEVSGGSDRVPHSRGPTPQAHDPTCHLLTRVSGLAKSCTTHKFAHGHALIISGDHGRSGAARLAARGALRIGAGLVTVASPTGAMAENAARLDAIMLRKVDEGADLAMVLADRRINALCLGPGLGTGQAQADLLSVALQRRGEPRLVLDADALTLLSQHPDLFAALNESCVLTPHAGEFARLFPDIANTLNSPATSGPAYSKVDAAREAAARAGCVVLFKGPDTVIADPSGRSVINAAVHDHAAPWLATAGSGDVLSGFITGLLVRGFSSLDAACTGAWLHVECARSFGPGLIAEDLPEEVPLVFRSLGL